MNQFSRMNKKLDEGWKLTTLNCDCKTSFLIKVDTKELYCPRCDKISKQQFIIDQEEDDVDEQDNDYPQSYLGVDKFETVKSDAASKKMGELLIQGWAMLEQTCLKCCFPIMKSKKGVKLCVYCNEDIQEPSKVKQESVVKQESLKEDQKKEIQKVNYEEDQKQIIPQQITQQTAQSNEQQQATPQPQGLNQFQTVLLNQFHLQLQFLSKQLNQCNYGSVVHTIEALTKTYKELNNITIESDKMNQVLQDFDTYLKKLLISNDVGSYLVIIDHFIALFKLIKQK